jgi:oxygen-independent coproporphyrinogen III oxidase
MTPQFSRVDIDLLKKYDRPGPRYTSYPTAPLFSEAFDADDYRQEILRTNGPDSHADLSLYFHFPFCDTLCYFCGCTMLVTRDRNRIAEYLTYLKREVDIVAPLIGKGRRVTQIHWGGGTPTHLTPEEILDFAGYVQRAFTIAPDAEMSVEIDPRELTQQHLGALRHVGFNRMSMGIQDFNPDVQAAVNRVQPEELSLNVFRWASALEFESMNVDLIYGLPLQTASSFEQTLRRVVRLKPHRIAVFNYAHVPWMKSHQKLIRPEDLPTPEQKLGILKMTIEFLSVSGYEYIGMDHFAKPTDELTLAQKNKTLYRNFQGYSTRSGADLYGFGMSSISHFEDIYAQNTKVLPQYYQSLEQGELPTHVGYRMTEDDRIRKHVIMRLMCDLELDIRDVEGRFGIVFGEYFAGSRQALRLFVEDGLVEVRTDRLAVVGAGRLVLRNIAMCFDAYLEKMSGSKPIFSRTV